MRAFGAVGATRAGRSRVRCVDPRDLGEIRGGRARSGEIDEIGDLPKVLPRFAEIEIRSDLKSSDLREYDTPEFHESSFELSLKLPKLNNPKNRKT